MPHAKVVLLTTSIEGFTDQLLASDSQDFGRSPSSLSYCDPNNQPPPEPVSAVDSPPDEVIKPESTVTNTVKIKKRRLSWLPLRSRPEYPRSTSDSLRILREPSTTSLAKSTISAPILTSTTNAEVAQSEGVHCGELSPDLFDKSTWDSKLGWLKNESKEVKVHLRTESRLQRLSSAVRGRGETNRLSFTMEETPSSGQKMARYKAETVNLCKDKIRTLTGITPHNRSQSASLQNMSGAERLSWDPPLLAPGNNTPSLASPQLSPNHEHFGSLTRSFNSILDRGLDSDTPTMEFLKKQASKLRLREEQQRKWNISEPFIPTEEQQRQWQAFPRARLASSSEEVLSQLPNRQVRVKADLTEEEVERYANDEYHPQAEAKRANDIAPKGSEETIVNNDDILRVEPARPRTYNPLGMHTDVMAFAQPPASVKLPDPRLPYPGQLYDSDEYPQASKPGKMDVMAFINESKDWGPESVKNQIKEVKPDVKDKESKRGIKKSISRLFGRK